jgi:hypothetical protein
LGSVWLTEPDPGAEVLDAAGLALVLTWAFFLDRTTPTATPVAIRTMRSAPTPTVLYGSLSFGSC